jgi:hypothetical protein
VALVCQRTTRAAVCTSGRCKCLPHPGLGLVSLSFPPPPQPASACLLGLAARQPLPTEPPRAAVAAAEADSKRGAGGLVGAPVRGQGGRSRRGARGTWRPGRGQHRRQLGGLSAPGAAGRSAVQAQTLGAGQQAAPPARRRLHHADCPCCTLTTWRGCAGTACSSCWPCRAGAGAAGRAEEEPGWGRWGREAWEAALRTAGALAAARGPCCRRGPSGGAFLVGQQRVQALSGAGSQLQSVRRRASGAR